MAASPVTSRITSLTRSATFAGPRTSRPTVTRYTRPLNRRLTRRAAHTIVAKVVLPNPPAPYSPVVIPTVPARPPTSAFTTAASSAGRPTTQSGTSSSGGNGIFDARGIKTHTAAAAATMPASAPNGAAHNPAWARPLRTRTTIRNTHAAALTTATTPSTIFRLTAHS